MYKCVVTKPFITNEIRETEMTRYPFDHVIFHPGNRCRTCLTLKPARSKHCSLCGTCVARHDHHCVWLANCVGLRNYRYFLLLLLSLSTLLMYGSYLGYSLLSAAMGKPLLPVDISFRKGGTGMGVFRLLRQAIASDRRVGSVFLLAVMTAPLAMTLLLYHLYLIWAGLSHTSSLCLAPPEVVD